MFEVKIVALSSITSIHNRRDITLNLFMKKCEVSFLSALQDETFKYVETCRYLCLPKKIRHQLGIGIGKAAALWLRNEHVLS